ncbi:MAG: hypothetical protein GX892_07040 [Thermoanaerobacteraceae bacterium]|nr:hypothetical protein [Thermoanaerobacteraceae bacterium]
MVLKPPFRPVGIRNISRIFTRFIEFAADLCCSALGKHRNQQLTAYAMLYVASLSTTVDALRLCSKRRRLCFFKAGKERLEVKSHDLAMYPDAAKQQPAQWDAVYVIGSSDL